MLSVLSMTESKKKPTKKTKEMLEENAKQIEELKALQTELDHELDALDQEEKELGERWQSAYCLLL